MPDALNKILVIPNDDAPSDAALLKRAEFLSSRLNCPIDRFDGEPELQTIVRRAEQVGANLIMKSAPDSRYLTGLSTNLDWDLIRHSPAHVWFVGVKTTPPETVLAAVGSSSGPPFDALDYDVGEVVAQLKSHLELTSLVLHTCQEGASERDPEIRAWADYFQLAPAEVRVLKGSAADELSATAEALNVDLIVMGARNLSRVERFISPVTAEPVVSNASCDVLIVRDTRAAGSPDATEPAQPEFS
jgi:nucleotide-binding universal stress UspA family protein